MAVWTDIKFANFTPQENVEINRRLRYAFSKIDPDSIVGTINDIDGTLILSKGGTGASLTAPAADSIFFYDLSEASAGFLTVGVGLAISGTTIYNTIFGAGSTATFYKITATTANLTDVNSTGTISVDTISFNLSPSTDPLSEGEMRWNDDDKTLNLQTEASDVTLQIGQELYLRVTNKTTSSITNGQLVYINGAQGNRPTIALAQASTESTADTTIAMVTGDIASNNTGYATHIGLVRDVDTSAFAEGDVLYLSSTSAGGFVNTVPASPSHAVKIGYVVTSGVTGTILVAIDTGTDIDELHDTCLTSPVTDNVITYSSSSGCWYNSDTLNLSILASSSATIKELYASSAIFGNSTSYTRFESDGTMEMTGDARTFRDEVGDITKLKIKGVGITEDSTDAVVNFSTNANLADYLYTNVQLNHDRDATADIYPHIHWFQKEDNSVNWLIQYRWHVNCSTIETSWTDVPMNNLACVYSTGTLLQISFTTPISVPSGSTLSDILQIRVIRDVANGSTQFASTDNYSLPASALSFDVHIETNTLGSRTEYTK